MLKAVSFDLWFTIFQSPKSYDDRMDRYRISRVYQTFKPLKIFPNKTAFLARYHECTAKFGQMREQDGGIDFSNDYQIGIIVDCLIHGSPIENAWKSDPNARSEMINALRKPYAEPLLRFLPKLAPHIRHALTYCKQQGLKTILISNTGRTPGRVIRQVLIRYKLLSLFDFVLFSDEIALSKPNPKIFEYALSQLQISPGECLHIGDILHLDIWGPEHIGMKAALYTGLLHINHYHRPKILNELEKKPPKYVIGDFSEMADLLTAISNDESWHTPRKW